jgi:hypothetical protein
MALHEVIFQGMVVEVGVDTQIAPTQRVVGGELQNRPESRGFGDFDTGRP